MDVDIQNADKSIQIDPLIGSSSRNIITTEVKSISTDATLSAASFNIFDSLALTFFRLSKSHRKCSICEVYFSNNKIRFIEIDTELRIDCLFDHHIYVQEDSRCCTSHLIDGRLSQKSIEKMNGKKLNEPTITSDETIKLFQEIRDEIRSKKKTR